MTQMMPWPKQERAAPVTGDNFLKAPASIPAPPPMPTSPVEILARNAAAKPSFLHRNPLVAVLAGLAALQVVAPEEMKPSVFAGDVAADFYGQIMDTSRANQLRLAQEQALAERVAQLEAARADWIGQCSLVGIVSPELAQGCIALAEQRYNTSLAEARRSLGQ